MEDVEPEISSACRTVHNLLQAQESLIQALRERGMLDARAGDVLAAIDRLKTEADQARQRAGGTWTAAHRDHPVAR